MIDAVMSWMAPVAGGMFVKTGRAPQRDEMALAGGAPCYNIYRAADGEYLTVCAVEPHFWGAFCNAIGRPDLEVRQYDGALIGELQELFGTRPRSEWLEHFAAVDACVEPLNDVAEAANHPLIRARGLISEREDGGLQFGPAFPAGRDPGPAAAELGRHTHEVLQAAGLSAAEIEALAAANVIKQA
jgi:crotonobetainyl-CoA:carnitine CoA-transferase CaiB-like acyl-CoA transferase